MKKLSKKLVALLMVMTMVLAMGVTSFAAETRSATQVTVVFQQRDTTVNPATQSEIETVTQVNVDTTDTVQTAVDKALEKIGGSAVWVDVPATDDYAAYTYLKSVTIDGHKYENNYSYSSEGSLTRYTGTSWMWNTVDNQSYPDDYMDQATVGNNTIFYLTFEKSSFTF